MEIETNEMKSMVLHTVQSNGRGGKSGVTCMTHPRSPVQRLASLPARMTDIECYSRNAPIPT